MRLGILSDTHGLLRPEIFGVFEGVDHILHAGDAGDPDILTALEAVAPLTAVWGNVDGWEVRDRVPEVAEVTLGGVRVVVLHGHRLRAATPVDAVAAHPGAGLVVFGHSHRPVVSRVGATLAVNPGSAGPRRFRDPVTVALARIEDGVVSAELVDLLG
jgi:uncharacterized protein